MSKESLTFEDDLKLMSLADVLGLQVRRSGKTWEDVAAVCGWPAGVTNRIRQPDDDYWPTLPRLPRFCVATKSTLVCKWIQAQAEAGGLKYRDPEPFDCMNALKALADLTIELGDVANEIREAVHNKTIDHQEAKRILRKLYDLCGGCMSMIAGMRAIKREAL